ncbi:MAG: hypothetical protein NT069_27305 [Planctomycetota bacterium]|nr:hypothetical protein [Planctomycetota bacterium]
MSPVAVAGPISITTADGAGADTQLRQGRPENNYGASTRPAIKYQSDTSGNNRKVYL